jgi:hypothetical protein
MYTYLNPTRAQFAEVFLGAYRVVASFFAIYIDR